MEKSESVEVLQADTGCNGGRFLMPGQAIQDAKLFLEKAISEGCPANFTQRRGFAEVMPQLYYYKSKGYSFEELTVLLRKCGFRLRVSTVKKYYFDLIKEMETECIEQMRVMEKAQKSMKIES